MRQVQILPSLLWKIKRCQPAPDKVESIRQSKIKSARQTIENTRKRMR